MICFSPLRGQLAQLFSTVFRTISKSISVFNRLRFTCYVEQFSDESQPVRQDQLFRVQIGGLIPTEQDNVDTDIQIEIGDITDGQSQAHQVLSTDSRYRNDETAEFQLIQHNGIVPDKNAVLARRVTVAVFPCHVLRFAYRGRRKLLFRATVLEKSTGSAIISAQRVIEYVYCSDGYREVHGRRLEVLQACAELAAIILGSPPYPKEIKNLWSESIQQNADMSLPADEVTKTIEAIENRFESITMRRSSDIILAYGKNTDRFFAIELALQTASLDGFISKDNFEKLFQASEMLEVRQDRFLSSTQKLLLSTNCEIEAPSQLLGITPDMDSDTFRKHLNEEYRKWNSRVTHPDAQIRRQADQILTLIAEIRSQRLQSSP